MGLISYLYGVIRLYCYRLIYLYRYCVIYLLLYCMLEAWGYYFLYIYILFLFLTSTSIFFDSGCRLSIIWLFTVQRYGGLSDTKHQAMPYSAKTFPESLPQMLHIWVFQKTFYRIAWCSDSWEPPFLYARKKAI